MTRLPGIRLILKTCSMANEYIDISGSFQRRNIDGGDPPSGYTVNSSASHVLENSVDNSAKNPNWRNDIKNGNCATTYLSGIKETLTRSPATFSISSPHGDFVRGSEVDEQKPWRASSPSLVSVSYADSQARTKLIAKANEYQRPFMGGVALGELRETLRMIKNPGSALFDRIGRHIDDARSKTKRYQRGTDRYRKAASGLWLEAVFGWLPLISDIEDGAKALSKLANNASLRRKLIIASGSSEDVIDSNLGQTHYARGDIRASYAYRQTTSVSVRYRAMLQWDSSTYSKFRYFGLNFGSILPTALELVPWSFLIDYFSNIGDIVEGFSFGTQRLRWVDRGEKISSHRIFRLRSWYPNLSPNGPGEGWFTPETIISSRETVRRNQVNNFDPVPDFHFEIPGSKQFANMAALLSNKSKFI